ncbi:hypothetical protein [Streptomyces erythrochromogenes]|uniref:hypothetical protein n=1 Tax=Streptomyces erythrochromogenes TaxID=285574 RepID=UPI00382E698C
MSPYWYADTKHDLLEPPWTGPRASRPCRPGNRGPAGRPGRVGRPGRLKESARSHRQVRADHPWVAPLGAAHPNIAPHARTFDAPLQRLMDATGLAGAARTEPTRPSRRFPYGCGGAVRRMPEENFCLALDVLTAGIEARATTP